MDLLRLALLASIFASLRAEGADVAWAIVGKKDLLKACVSALFFGAFEGGTTGYGKNAPASFGSKGCE